VSSAKLSVSTIDLDDLASRLHLLGAQCHDRALSLEGVASLMPIEWHARAQAIATQVSQASRDLQAISHGLQSASESYSGQEAAISAAAHEVSSALFWGMGRLLTLFPLAVIPSVISGFSALLTAWAVTGKRPEELLSSPVVATGLGHVVSGVDDLAAGFLGIPLPVMRGIGERGLGLSGPPTVAGGILLGLGGISGIGAPPETLVTVTRVSSAPGQPPGGVEDLLARIPRANPDMPQVRIERYEAAGDADANANATFIVYLGGTIDAALLATDEPWDMTSNLAALADMDAGSQRAAVEAMKAAGIASDNLVTLVGHSQGGLIAARIAQSEEFRVGDVVTVGAPIHQVPVPRGVIVTAIEHNEDLVPKLGGLAVPGAAGAGTTTMVRRSALKGGVVSGSDPLPGHNLSRYVETGRVMDTSSDTQLMALKKRLAARADGTPLVSMWRGERVLR
jgi:pimeloyl-ACP methyl ester carboxylesterase